MAKYTHEQRAWIAKQWMETEIPAKELFKMFNEKFNMQIKKHTINNIVNQLGLKREWKLYSAEQYTWLIDKYQNTIMPLKEITAAFNEKYKQNRTSGAVGKALERAGIKKRTTLTFYTDEQKEWIAKTYATGVSRQETAILFNKKFGKEKTITANSKAFKYVVRRRKVDPASQVRNMKNIIVKDEQRILAIYIEPERKTYSEVADIYNQTAKVKIKPHHVMTTIRKHLAVRKDTTVNNELPQYTMQKDAYGRWRIKLGKEQPTIHTVIYEYMIGKIEKDEVVIFADGNAENFELDNLIKIDKRVRGSMASKNPLLAKFGKGSITKAWVEIKKLEYEIAEMIKMKKLTMIEKMKEKRK